MMRCSLPDRRAWTKVLHVITTAAGLGHKRLSGYVSCLYSIFETKRNIFSEHLIQPGTTKLNKQKNMSADPVVASSQQMIQPQAGKRAASWASSAKSSRRSSCCSSASTRSATSSTSNGNNVAYASQQSTDIQNSTGRLLCLQDLLLDRYCTETLARTDPEARARRARIEAVLSPTPPKPGYPKGLHIGMLLSASQVGNQLCALDGLSRLEALKALLERPDTKLRRICHTCQGKMQQVQIQAYRGVKLLALAVGVLGLVAAGIGAALCGVCGGILGAGTGTLGMLAVIDASRSDPMPQVIHLRDLIGVGVRATAYGARLSASLSFLFFQVPSALLAQSLYDWADPQLCQLERRWDVAHWAEDTAKPLKARSKSIKK